MVCLMPVVVIQSRDFSALLGDWYSKLNLPREVVEVAVVALPEWSKVTTDLSWLKGFSMNYDG